MHEDVVELLLHRRVRPRQETRAHPPGDRTEPQVDARRLELRLVDIPPLPGSRAAPGSAASARGWAGCRSNGARNARRLPPERLRRTGFHRQPCCVYRGALRSRHAAEITKLCKACRRFGSAQACVPVLASWRRFSFSSGRAPRMHPVRMRRGSIREPRRVRTARRWRSRSTCTATVRRPKRSSSLRSAIFRGRRSRTRAGISTSPSTPRAALGSMDLTRSAGGGLSGIFDLAGDKGTAEFALSGPRAGGGCDDAAPRPDAGRMARGHRLLRARIAEASRQRLLLAFARAIRRGDRRSRQARRRRERR